MFKTPNLLLSCLILAALLVACSTPGHVEPSYPQPANTLAPSITPSSASITPDPKAPGIEPGAELGGEPGQEPGKPTRPPADSPITSARGPTLPAQPEIWQPTPASPDWKPQPGDEALARGQVFIDQADVLVMESFPPQYRLILKGSLPTICHQLRIQVLPPDEQKRIQVEAYSLVQKDVICVQVLAPFDVSVPLQGLAAGSYTVWVNGEKVGEVVIP